MSPKPRAPQIVHPRVGTCLACKQGVTLTPEGAPVQHHSKRVNTDLTRVVSEICRGTGARDAYYEYEQLARIQRAQMRGEEQ